MSDVIASDRSLLHMVVAGDTHGKPVVVLGDSIYSGDLPSHADPLTSIVATMATAGKVPDRYGLAVYGIGQISNADGDERSVGAHTWAVDAAAVATWLAAQTCGLTTSTGGAHLIGIGNAAALATLIAMDHPALVATVTLVNPLIYLPASDALFDPSLAVDNHGHSGPGYWIAASQLLHARKAMLATQLERIRSHGVSRPVHLLFDHANGCVAGMAAIEIFDLFAARQFHTSLHIASEAGALGPLANEWLASFSTARSTAP